MFEMNEVPKACIFLRGLIDLDATILKPYQVDIVKDVFAILEQLEQLYNSIMMLESEVFEITRSLNFNLDKKLSYERGERVNMDTEWYGTYEEVCSSVDVLKNMLAKKYVPIRNLENISEEKTKEMMKTLEKNNAKIELEFNLSDKNTYKLWFN